MRSAVKLTFGCWLVGASIGALAAAGTSKLPPIVHFRVLSAGQTSWPQILEAAGYLPAGPGDEATLYVIAGPEQDDSSEVWERRLAEGAFLVLEGSSALAVRLGFRPTGTTLRVRSVRDRHDPELEIIWEKDLDVATCSIPEGATVFTWERWSKTPLVAGYRHGRGAVLWVATSPGTHGYERFPYLLQALRDLGLQPPFESRQLWAFFDSSYRLRVDLEYFARRWRRAGVAALHVAAWHYWEPDPGRDAYLKRLIEECHRHGILVYAWLEFPHVSEKFWEDHPEWREKTAILQDAHLDWRKLMNLADPACFAAVASGLRQLLSRFDWDGVNLAELYFESLEGASNPARFTPMNAIVRQEFQARHGFDPIELFRPGSPHEAAAHPEALQLFLEYRAGLVQRLQLAWMEELSRIRRTMPHLGLVLTHVDDRFDREMRQKIGADAARTLEAARPFGFVFLVEDPATIWHLGPERYLQLAQAYAPIAPDPARLAIDINIVERYQDVYPTKKQTGVELLRQLHLAARAFPRVAVYAEHSMLRADTALIPAALSTVTMARPAGAGVLVESARPVRLRWPGAARLNGQLWPASDGEAVLLPAGRHWIEPSTEAPVARLVDFNGDLQAISPIPGGLEFSYASDSRAIAILDRKPLRVEVDGALTPVELLQDGEYWALLLPRGQHVVGVWVSASGTPGLTSE